MSDSDPKWELPHDGHVPSDNRAVAVLLATKSGFLPAIGRYYGKEGWVIPSALRTRPVVAWANIPYFEDTVELKDHPP